MITKFRLSDNASLGDISTNSNCGQVVGLGGTESSNSEEPSLDGMKSEEQWTNHSDSKLQWSSGPKASIPPGPLASDDSCNAVDNKLSGENDTSERDELTIGDGDLSFNGKIKPLTIDDASAGVATTGAAPAGEAMHCELIDATKGFERTDSEVTDDVNRRCRASRKDRLNESLELLTKENSSWIHYNNEKSPDLFADDDNDADGVAEERNQFDHVVDAENDDPDEDVDAESCTRNKKRRSGGGFETDDLYCTVEGTVSSDTVERVLLKRLQSSLSGVPPPPSLTYSHIDVERMLALYQNNLAQWGWGSACRESQSMSHEAASRAEKVGHCIETEPLPQCLSKPTRLTAELDAIGWPDLMRHRAHGLHYNKSTVSEKIELLGLKYIERYIGAETSSSFNMCHSPSSAKKRNQRMKMLNQSPGSRLSHLARRRAIFSSANLLNNSAGSGTNSGSIVSASRSTINASALNRLNPFRLCNRQVLLDPKKSDNRRKNKVKTPQRRSPGGLGRKSPRRRTPGSSAKKFSLARTSASAKPSQQLHVPATIESSKRALFLSPPNGGGGAAASSGTRHDQGGGAGSNSKQMDRSIFSEARMLKSRRSLFSPPRAGSTQEDGGAGGNGASSVGGVSLKRRRSPTTVGEGDQGFTRGAILSEERSEKIRRKESTALVEEDLTPRSLKFARSQSFCVGSQTVSRVGSQMAATDCVGGKALFRANSEITSEDTNRPVMMLTENHKKKLLWAVSQALQGKQVSTKHEKFKQHASNLARVVKRLFLEFNDQTISSTSEKMLRLANKHVFEVIQGKSVDDIYFREKTRIMNARNQTKLQGYIAPEEYELRKLKRTGSMTSVGNSSATDGASPFDCCSLSASQTTYLSQSSMLSQGSSIGMGSFSQLSESGNLQGARQLRTAASTGSVNIVGVTGQVAAVSLITTTALRENIDSELRQRSTQKLLSFSGKDQKNVSPYRVDKAFNAVVGSNANANNKLLVGGSLNSSIMKAKRQISFE
ncbi:AGAP005115-PA-like protein [Anopheles sinensis]|uniref:AGAP005115-PA-like protein n=1 Tax=Anopheles sinensis TaxID=74873 RepID=A0A084W9L3_ANOSI|nr:AGAP005115-PA-like protein [Anopheles sinensis]